MDYTYFLDNHLSRTPLKIYDTKYALIITSEKIASSYLNKFFRNEFIQSDTDGDGMGLSISLPQLKFDYTFDASNVGKWDVDIGGSTDESILKKSENLKLFINGKLKKDVIILIKNPWKRFVSAFTEDYLKSIIINNHPHVLFQYGASCLKKDKELYDWWIYNKSLINRFKMLQQTTPETKELSSDENFYKCIRYIIHDILMNWHNFNTNIFDGHNSMYHSKILHILFNIKNRNKIKIFDIDCNDLDKVFSKYTIGTKSLGKVHTSGYFRNILESILNDETSVKLKEEILNNIEHELASYFNLKTIESKQND